MSATWDSKSVKGTPLAADELLIIDTATGRDQKRATISSLPVGSQTPWTSNIDAAGFSLDNLSFLASNAANPSSEGAIRLGLTETIGWRHSSGTTNFLMGYDLHTNNDFVLEFTSDRNVANPASLTIIDNRSASAGRIITNVNFVALDSLSNLTTYGLIATQQEAIGGASLEEGSMRFHVRQAGDVLSTFITLNDNEGDDITFARPLNMFSRGIFNVDGTDGISILNPADNFSYQIISSAIVADRTATLPLLTGNDTFVFEAHAATLTNKTIASGSNTITGLTNTEIAAGAEILVSKLADGTPGQFIRTDAAGTGVEWTDDVFTINFIIDGGGSVITTGIKGQITVDVDCEVIEWAVIGLPAGAIVVDVHRSTFAGFPTTASIAGTELPTITATNDTGEDRTITTWSDINAGDILEFIVDSVATIERCTVALVCRKLG